MWMAFVSFPTIRQSFKYVCHRINCVPGKSMSVNVGPDGLTILIWIGALVMRRPRPPSPSDWQRDSVRRAISSLILSSVTRFVFSLPKSNWASEPIRAYGSLHFGSARTQTTAGQRVQVSTFRGKSMPVRLSSTDDGERKQGYKMHRKLF